jgi:hypothetical protein
VILTNFNNKKGVKFLFYAFFIFFNIFILDTNKVNMENKIKEICLFCKKENPKNGMKTCSRKCADELKKINSREERECLFCKKKFCVRKKDTKKICSEECRKEWSSLPENIDKRIEASKIAVKDKFGVENVFQLETTKEKLKKTKLEKYGDENYNNSKKMLETKDEKYGSNWGKDWYIKMSEQMMKNFGVAHPLQHKIFLDKLNNSNLEKYGFKWVSQVETFKEKMNKSIKEKYGVDNISQLDSIKEKKKETSLNNFGVTHHLKDYDLFQKHLIAQYKVKKYKETDLYYQGSYEYFFLEKMEELNLLNELNNGKSYEFEWGNEKRTYHTDFFFRGENIEIKSGWTYNKNGKDIALENFNKTKWKSVIDFGDKINVLINKDAIKSFIVSLQL